jgi:hypothetical protein
MVGLAEQLVAEGLKIGELAVEAEGEPLAFFQVMPFERLSVVAVVRAARGIANVANCRAPRIFPHQALGFAAVRQAKHLADRPHLLVCVQKLLAAGIETGHSRSQLAAVLNIKQHPGQKPRDFVGAAFGTERMLLARQVIDRGNAAFMVQVAHWARGRPAQRAIEGEAVLLNCRAKRLGLPGGASVANEQLAAKRRLLRLPVSFFPGRCGRRSSVLASSTRD